MKKKILTLLVLLMTAVTGAWAQEQSETIATTAKIVEGTHFTISNNGKYADGDGMSAVGGITVTPKNGETITKVVISCTYFPDLVNDDNTSVSSGTKEITNGGGTITVTGVNASTFTFTCSESGPQFGQFVVYYAPDYYLVGNMTSWGIDPQYKLALNESAGDANEYQIAVVLPAATELKVVSSTDGSTIKDWFPAEAGKYTVTADGLYTIYFRPGYNGGDDWHANCIYVADGVNLTTDGEAWTLAQMPACDVELEVEYYPAMLTFAPNATEGGTVEVVGLTGDALPAGFEKDAEGNIYVAEGTTFTVKATPAEGYHFVCWSDDAENTDPEREITMPADGSDLSLTATFAENEYDITFSEGTNPDPENPEWTATPNPAKTKQTVTVTYTGSRKVIGVKAEKKSSAPTLKDALADGATVVITYTWSGTNVTTFTYTNNGGNYTGSTTGDDAEYFANVMSMDGTTLRFTASNPDHSDANVSIDFYTDANEYVISKGSSFTSFTISVNGTDVTSQLTEVK